MLSRGSAAPFGGGRLDGDDSKSVQRLDDLVARVPISVAGDLSRLSVLNRMGWCGGWENGK